MRFSLIRLSDNLLPAVSRSDTAYSTLVEVFQPVFVYKSFEDLLISSVLSTLFVVVTIASIGATYIDPAPAISRNCSHNENSFATHG